MKWIISLLATKQVLTAVIDTVDLTKHIISQDIYKECERKELRLMCIVLQMRDSIQTAIYYFFHNFTAGVFLA